MKEERYYLMYHGVKPNGLSYTALSASTPKDKPISLDRCLSHLPSGEQLGLDYFIISESQYNWWWKEYLNR